MRKSNIIRIAFLPIFAFIFLIGWVLANIGEQKLAAKKAARPEVLAAKNEDPVEIGLLAKDEEESVVIESYQSK